MVFAHVCELRGAAPHLRAGANAVANACFQRALTGTTPGTRRLDLRSSKSLTGYSSFASPLGFVASTQRNPKITSRSLRSTTFRYEDCISRRLIVPQEPPRNTPQSLPVALLSPLYVSRHHSQTFPPTS